MASIERTVYPRFKRQMSARELHEAFTPSADDRVFVAGLAGGDADVLASMLLLKSFQRLGYFPRLAEVPAVVVEHVRACLSLPAGVTPGIEASRTEQRRRAAIRTRLGVVYEPGKARAVAEGVIRAVAQVKDNPADLINVALEELVKARCELPDYTTLDELAATVRTEVNTGIFNTIGGRMSDADIAMLDGLLAVDAVTKRSAFDRVKQPAKAATITHFREHVARLGWLDSLGDSQAWLVGVPAAKVAHFAGQTRV